MVGRSVTDVVVAVVLVWVFAAIVKEIMKAMNDECDGRCKGGSGISDGALVLTKEGNYMVVGD